MITVAGFRALPGVLIVPLQDEFGWSRASVSLAISISLVLFGLAGPFAAALVERFGMRRTIGTAIVLIAGGYALTLLVDAPWQLVLVWGLLVGPATAVGGSPLAAIVSNRWFVSHRGLVTGVLGANFATGQLVFLPLLAWVEQRWGWRASCAVIAAVALCLVLPLLLVLVRERPSDMGLRRLGADEDDPLPVPTGNPFAHALAGLRLGAGNKAFWLLAGSFFICGVSTNGLITTHLIPAAHDHGIGQVTAAGMLALIGVFDVVGTLCSGWLTDRFDPRRLLLWYYTLRGLSLFALPWAFDGGTRMVAFAVFFGLDFVATVPPTIALTGRVFGREYLAVVFGWIFAAHQLGAGLMAWAAGATRTWEGDYRPAFFAAGALCFVAGSLVSFLDAPERPRPLVPAEAEA